MLPQGVYSAHGRSDAGAFALRPLPILDFDFCRDAMMELNLQTRLGAARVDVVANRSMTLVWSQPWRLEGRIGQSREQDPAVGVRSEAGQFHCLRFPRAGPATPWAPRKAHCLPA